MKAKTLIVWQDGRPDLERTALNLGERLTALGRDVVARKASDVTIPEILAATYFLFGADEAESVSYKEIGRILRGVNLAGRHAACFGGNGAAVAWLREMLRDSELEISGPDLVGNKFDQTAIANLLRVFA